jgi:hypothetical protein
MMDPQKSNAEAPAKQARKARWMHRHPKKFLLLVNLVGLLFVLCICEIVLRFIGYHPGYLEMGWTDFQPLERGAKLEVRNDFYTDSLGIFVASDQPNVHAPEVHVNSLGFRGPEFEPQDSSRKKVMLIGDSFTWGATAKPIDSSFADLIRRPDWQVMNFGIPGADPDQYARVAEVYIPQMNPDVVCLFFYMANDVMHLPQQVKPYQNRYHLTNVGWLNPFLDGPYIGDAQATYDYCVERFSIPKTGIFNRFCALTCIGTFVWRGLVRMHWIQENYRPEMQKRLDESAQWKALGPFAWSHIFDVEAACAIKGIPFRLFIIPAHNAIHRPTPEEMKTLFEGIDTEYCDALTTDDYYGRPDGHFNNAGHRKMAKFVAQELEIILGK